MERNLTEGSVFKNIIYFSLPYLLSYFLQTLYGMADLFIIGQFEGVSSTINKVAVFPVSVAALFLSLAPMACPMFIVAPIARPTIITVSICITWLPMETATLFMVLSVVLTVVLFLSVNAIVSIMSTPEEALAGTALYLKIGRAHV